MRADKKAREQLTKTRDLASKTQEKILNGPRELMLNALCALEVEDLLGTDEELRERLGQAFDTLDWDNCCDDPSLGVDNMKKLYIQFCNETEKLNTLENIVSEKYDKGTCLRARKEFILLMHHLERHDVHTHTLERLLDLVETYQSDFWTKKKQELTDICQQFQPEDIEDFLNFKKSDNQEYKQLVMGLSNRGRKTDFYRADSIGNDRSGLSRMFEDLGYCGPFQRSGNGANMTWSGNPCMHNKPRSVIVARSKKEAALGIFKEKAKMLVIEDYQ
jgi:hypothetical protein